MYAVLCCSSGSSGNNHDFHFFSLLTPTGFDWTLLCTCPDNGFARKDCKRYALKIFNVIMCMN